MMRATETETATETATDIEVLPVSVETMAGGEIFVNFLHDDKETSAVVEENSSVSPSRPVPKRLTDALRELNGQMHIYDNTAEDLGKAGMLEHAGHSYLGRLKAIGGEIKNRLLKESFLETLDRNEDVKKLRDQLSQAKFQLPVPGGEQQKEYHLSDLPAYYGEQIRLAEANKGIDRKNVNLMKKEKKTVENWVGLMNDPRSTDAKIVDGCIKLLKGLGVGVMLGGVGGAAYALTLVKWGLVGGGLAVAGVGMAMTWPIWVGAIGITLAAVAGYVLYKTYKRHEHVVDQWFNAHLKDPTLKVAHAAWDKTKQVFGPMVTAVGNFVGAYVEATVHFKNVVKLDNGWFRREDNLNAKFGDVHFNAEERQALITCYKNAVEASLIYDGHAIPTMNEDYYTQIAQLSDKDTLSDKEKRKFFHEVMMKENKVRSEHTFSEMTYNGSKQGSQDLKVLVVHQHKRIEGLEKAKHEVEKMLIKHGSEMTLEMHSKFMNIREKINEDLGRELGLLQNLKKEKNWKQLSETWDYVAHGAMLSDVKSGLSHAGTTVAESPLGVGVGHAVHGAGEGLSHAGTAIKGVAASAGHSVAQGFSHIKDKINESRKPKEDTPVLEATEEATTGPVFAGKLGSFFKKRLTPDTHSAPGVNLKDGVELGAVTPTKGRKIVGDLTGDGDHDNDATPKSR